MERYHRIIEHEKFQKYLVKIEQLEKDRIFCCHGLTHLLDVARIAYIINLEEGGLFSKDLIYGAALLHDIGKVKQYTKKIPHEITGAQKAEKILAECGYQEFEIELIKRAVLEHRDGPENRNHRLSGILYEADKKSRICRFCEAKDACNWTEQMKNSTIVY